MFGVGRIGISFVGFVNCVDCVGFGVRKFWCSFLSEVSKAFVSFAVKK